MVGIPVSAVAYGFLALVTKIQEYLFVDLPTDVGMRVVAVRRGREWFIDPDGDDVSYIFEVSTAADFSSILLSSVARDVPFFTIPDVLERGHRP